METLKKWIVITGLDGAGKTTLERNLVDFFKDSYLVKSFKLPCTTSTFSFLDICGDGLPLVDICPSSMISSTYDSTVNLKVKNWKNEYDLLISQEVLNINNCLNFLEIDIFIHLNCNYEVAYQRIMNTTSNIPKNIKLFKDLKNGEKETKEIYENCISVNDITKTSKHFYLDTTSLSKYNTLKVVNQFLNDFVH